MSGEDFIIKVGANFTGVEAGIAKLRRSLAELERNARSPEKVARVQEARKSLVNIEGAGRAVSEKSRATGQVDLASQRRLAALAGLTAKQSKLPGGMELAIREYFSSIDGLVSKLSKSKFDALVSQTMADVSVLQKQFASQSKGLPEFTAYQSTRVATEAGVVPAAVRRHRTDVGRDERATAESQKQLVQEHIVTDQLTAFIEQLQKGIVLWTRIVANLEIVSALGAELAVLQRQYNAAVSKNINATILANPALEKELNQARQPGRRVSLRSGMYDKAEDVTQLLGATSLGTNDLVNDKAIGDVRRQLLALLSSELLTEEQRLAISRETLGSENMILALTQAQARHKLELQALDAAQKALVAQSIASGKLKNASDITAFTKTGEAQILRLTQERVMQLMTEFKLQSGINTSKAQIKAALDKIKADQLGIVQAGGTGGGSGGRVAPGAGAGGTDQPKNLWQKVNFGAGALGTLRYAVPSIALFGGLSAISTAVKTANDLQLEFSIIQTQLANIGQTNAFEHIQESVLQTAKDTGQAVSDLARLERQLIGAFSGLDPTTTLGSMSFVDLAEQQMRSAGQLAEVVGLPLTEITDGLTAASLAFDKTFAEIGDTVVALEDNTGVLGKETVNFLGDIAPVAKEAGFSMEEMSVLAVQVQQRSGRSGTALAEQFNRIIPAVSAAKAELLGMAAAEESLGTPEFIDALYNNDIAFVLHEIGKAYGDLSTSSQTSIVNLLGGRREAGALIPALANIDQFNELLGEANDAAGNLDARFAKVRETIANTLDRLRESAKQLFLTIYEGGLDSLLSALLDLGSGLIAVLDPALKILGGFLDLMGGMPAKLLTSIVMLRAMAAAYQKLTQTILAMTAAQQTQRYGAAGAGLMNFMGAPYGAVGANASMASGLTPSSGAASLRGGGLRAAGSSLLAAVGGVGGLGIAAGLTFVMTMKGYYDAWQSETNALVDEVRAADLSSEELLQRAEDFETGVLEDNGPGFWASVAAKVTGKDLLEKSEVMRAEAFRVDSENVSLVGELSGNKAFNSDKMERALEKEFGDYIGKRVEDVLVAQGYVVSRAAGTSADELVDQYKNLPGDKGGDVTAGLRDLEQALDIDLSTASKPVQDAFLDLQAAMSSNDPGKELAKLVNNKDLPVEALKFYEDAIDQFLDVLKTIDPEAYQRLVSAGSVVVGKIEKSKVSIEKMVAQEDAGTISTTELVAALRQEINKLEALEVDDPEALVDLRKQINDYRVMVTDALTQELDALTRIFDYGGEDSIDTINRKLFTALATFNQRDQTPEGVLGEYDQIRDFLIQRRQWMSDQASSEEEAAQIMAQEISIPPDVQVRAAVNALRELGVHVDTLQNVTIDGLDELSGAWIDAALSAFVSGEESIEQIIEKLQHGRVLIIEALGRAIDEARAKTGSMLGRVATINKLNNMLREVDEMISRASSGLLDPFAKGIAGEQNKNREKDVKDSMRQAQTALRLAQARGNSAAEAMIRLEDTRLAYMEAVADQESQADDIEARAAMIEAERDLVQTLNDRANEYRKAAAGFQSVIGNSVEAAEEEVRIAVQEYQFALAQYGTDSPQAASARTSLAQALIAQRNAMQQRKDAFVGVLLGLNKMDDDAVAVAQAEVNLAQQQLNEALGIDDRLSAQKRMLDAQKQLNQAMNEVRISQLSLRQAELDAYEDEIGSANIAVQIAQQQLADAQAAGAGQATINNLQAQLIAARKSADDTRIQEARDNYDFLYEMEQITKTEYIQYLESLKSALRPGTDAFKDLELTIKRLKDDISSDLQMNLPTSLSLPTLYEVRRLAGTTGLSQTTGQAIGYQDNRNMDVRIYVNNGMSPEQVVSAFTTAVGLGRNGYDPRIY